MITMLPRIFQRPLKFILWCTGVELVPSPASTTGFDIDDLAPRRAPLLIAVSYTHLTLPTICSV